MSGLDLPPLVVVVGAGGVGKTTVAAALGLAAAGSGHDTLVMTFDPSERLKDALGVGAAARDSEVAVAAGTEGRLDASLLDARRTFDRLIRRYAGDEEAAARILGNRFYQHLAGSLGGILEYMAVERLFEVAAAGEYGQVILDTPPTRQALDFLGAPRRIVGFLDSGAIRVALKPWFDAEGRLRPTGRLGPLGRRLERFLDEVVGLDLLRDMAEFFQAFAPLYDGFRQRARRVEALLASRRTRFLLVSGPGEEAIPDTLFFARRLQEMGCHLGRIVVNRVHPEQPGAAPSADPADGRGLLAWLAERDRAGLEALDDLLPRDRPAIVLPLMPEPPTRVSALAALAEGLEREAGGLRFAVAAPAGDPPVEE